MENFLIAKACDARVGMRPICVHMRALRAIAAIPIVIVLICGLAFAQQSVGEVTKVSGVATLEHAGRQSQVVEAMAVASGDTIRTTANGTVVVTFHDGSKAELGESSAFTIERYQLSGSQRIGALLKLWGGHLRTFVSALAGKPPEFEVHTPNSVAAVRGTDFDTAFVEGRPCPEDHTCMRYTTVGVTTGVVEVRNPGNPAPAVEVHEGYETTIPCESPPTSPAPLGVEELGAPGYH